MSTADDKAPVYTIGHSTRSLEEFVEILRGGGVRCVVDVRSIPRSRTNPQYNLDTLPEALAGWQIRHRFIEELGGRRPRQKDVDPEVNALWRNQSFHNYADYALSDTFREGLRELEELADAKPCAIMCSEAVWWRCHRRIVADYLLARGRPVFHLMGSDRIDPATMTSGARKQGETVVYPPA